MTRSKTAEVKEAAKQPSNFPAHIETHQLEISQDTHEQHVLGELSCYSTVYPDIDVQSGTQQHHLLVYKATTDHGILYLHQAMKQQDCSCFRTTI